MSTVTDKMFEAAGRAYIEAKVDRNQSYNDRHCVRLRAALTAALSGSPQVEAGTDTRILGQAIYRAMYESSGGKWEANESKAVWYKTAERMLEIARALRPREQEGGAAKSDLCIDCDGSGFYPSGAACKSCVGTGRVLAGHGAPHPPLPADGWKEGIEAAAKLVEVYRTTIIDRRGLAAAIRSLPTPPASTEAK